MYDFDPETGEVAFALSKNFEVITCPYCEQNFLLFAVLISKTLLDEDCAEVWSQGSTFFCPYCGKNIEKETDKVQRRRIDGKIQ